MNELFPVCVQCAGGLGNGLGVQVCAWKECQEEASIDEELLEDIKSVGIVRCVLVVVVVTYLMKFKTLYR